MPRRFIHLFVGVLALALSLVLVNLHLESRPGITGRTQKSGSGCTCHNSGGSVAISGPASLTVGQAGSYAVTLGGSSKTGVNIAASNGTLAPASPNMTSSGGELTFSAARDTNTWSFLYTPTTSGTKTLYAAGDVNGYPGSWAHATNFSVTATDPVAGVEGASPLSFELEQNFPNPFNPATTIRYTIAAASDVRLEIYSITGERVATLVNQVEGPGQYQVQFIDPGMSSGVYIYRLEARSTDGAIPGFVATRKLALVK